MLHREDDRVDASRRCQVREIEMEEDDSADYQQAADDQQAEGLNFPQVKIKEDEERLCRHLSKQSAFQPKRGDSYIMLCKLCLPRQTELSAYQNESSNLRKHVLVSTVFVPFH